MTKYLFLLCFIICVKLDAQENKTIIRSEYRHYISLKDYQKKYNITFNKIHSSDLKFRENDTLVWDKKQVRPKGTSVRYEYKDDNFLNVYKSIVFIKKNDSSSNTQSMKYWKRNINVFFSKSISKRNKKEFMRFAKNTLSEVDSLNIKEVTKIEDSNYTIYTSSDYDYESRMHSYKKTDFYMHWKKGSQIYKNSIKIFKNEYFNEKLELKAMKTYFIRSLGRFNFNNNLDCSHFFSGCLDTEDIVLSDLDKEIIKYHYSYGICKGTNQKTFEENHRKAKKILKKYNHLINFFHPIN